MMQTSGPIVRWREAGHGEDSWNVLEPAPGENTGFVEATQYEFEIPVGRRLRMDDEPLSQSGSIATQCVWSPGFFAGEVTAELLDPAGVSATLFLLDVAPDPAKLGRDVFRQMLEELWAEDPSLVVGSEPATTRIGEVGATQNPWLEFARLRRYAPEFLRAVRAIRVRPRRALQVSRFSAPLHYVRRVDRHTAAALLRSPAVAVLFAEGGHEPIFAVDSRLDVPVVEETLDAAANRAMLALTLALVRRARSLCERLLDRVERETESETRTSLASRWQVRRQFLENLHVELKILLRQAPFTHVRRAEITAAGLTAISADPAYARAWGRGWRALRHGLESGELRERLWVSPSWEIYERWCFLRLGKLLPTGMPGWTWRRESDPPKWVGAHGDRRAELVLQPTFRSSPSPVERMWSVSRERVPDLVLTVHGRERAHFVVLDAKYRVAKANVLDAMASAHIYQDSLRIGRSRPEGTLLLIPSAGGASWLEQPDFHEEHRVGVHPFSLENPGGLPVLLQRVLDSA